MMAYDNPNATIRREDSFLSVAGAAGVSCRFVTYQAKRLKAVHAMVVTAGSSNSPGHALTIKNGTTSIGLLALGTQTAGALVSVTGLNASVASLGLLSMTNGTDATGVALVTYEYHMDHDAAVSS
jgi:hypothetical protein